MKPRPHQAAAVHSIVGAFQAGARRGQYISACGTGKTATSFWVAEQLSSHRTLFCAPSIALVDQALEEWSKLGVFGALIVCSDTTVGDREHPIFTDPEDVERELVRLFECDGLAVVFSTYASAHLVQGWEFDLLIADEAHYIAGPDAKLAQVVMSDERVPIQRRLFQTATQRLAAEDGAWSMDDSELFGEVFHELSLPEAIRAGLLADYQLKIIGIRRSQTSLLESSDLEAQAAVVVKAIGNGDVRHLICFHRTTESGRAFVDLLIAQGLHAQTVFGDLPIRDRRKVVARGVKRDSAVFSTSKALAEGVDIPAVDSVMLVDPRSSPLELVQILGRALRRHKDKPQKIATVVLALVVPEGLDPERIVEASSWQKVWQVFQVLKSIDRRLYYEMNHAAWQDPERSMALLPETQAKVSIEGIQVPSELLARLREAVFLRAVKRTSDPFLDGCNAYRSYVYREDTTSVPKDHREGRILLGAWIARQRQLYHSGDLSRYAIRALEGLPMWTWDHAETAWNEAFSVLVSWAEEKGHSRVPGRKVYSDFELGNWVARQRVARKEGLLSEEQIALLESRPGWHWNPRRQSARARLEAARVFGAREGHMKVPVGHKERVGDLDVSLGSWVRKMRTRDPAGIKPNLREDLEALPGWKWSDRKAPRLFSDEEKLQALREWCDERGHSKPPRLEEHKGIPIGEWASRMRVAYAEDPAAIDPEMRKALDAIPEWSWKSIREQNDDEWLGALHAFYNREEHLSVPTRHVEGERKLGEWFKGIRTRQVARILERIGKEFPGAEL